MLRTAAAAAVAAAATLLWLQRRRRRRGPEPLAPGHGTEMQAALQAANAEPVASKHPIHAALCTERSYASEWLQLRMISPENWESLETRLKSMDATAGCIDPSVLGTDAGRDWAEVRVRLGSGADEWRTLRLPAYAAHLVDASRLWDPESSGTADEAAFWTDGTWSGSLLWDSAVHVVECMLGDAEWRGRLRGASVLELGCGLGLPGLLTHLLGARLALLTDRALISALVGEAIGCNGLPTEAVRAFELDWAPGAAPPILARHLGGSAAAPRTRHLQAARRSRPPRPSRAPGHSGGGSHAGGRPTSSSRATASSRASSTRASCCSTCCPRSPRPPPPSSSASSAAPATTPSASSRWRSSAASGPRCARGASG